MLQISNYSIWYDCMSNAPSTTTRRASLSNSGASDMLSRWIEAPVACLHSSADMSIFPDCLEILSPFAGV